MKKKVLIRDFGQETPVLCPIDPADIPLLPGEDAIVFKDVKPAMKEKYDFSLDGFSALNLPIPQTPEQEANIVNDFQRGKQLGISATDDA